MIIIFTVRIPIPFEEVPRSELLIAMGTGKVLRMPSLAQGRDDLTYDRLLASSAATFLGRGYTLSAHVCL